MFICSVSTVVFNGNPLLRFDGYYILMDILEIPNLRQKSTEVLKRWFQSKCLGLELQDNPFLPRRNLFLFGVFTIAAGIYRWVVVFGIIWFLNQVLKPYGLEAIGQMFAVGGVIGMIVQPLFQIYKFFKVPGRAQKMKRKNVLTSLSVAAAVIAGIVYIPFPFSVKCAFEVQPKDAIEVRAMVPGHLVAWNRRPGDVIRAGETLVSLENIDLRVQEVKYQSELQLAETKLEQLMKNANSDPKFNAELPAQTEARNSAKQMLRQIQEKKTQLQVRVPRDGIVIEPPSKPVSKAAIAEDQLPGWAGNPFSP